MTEEDKNELRRCVDRAILSTITACQATNNMVRNSNRQTVMDSVTRIEEILTGEKIVLPDEYRYVPRWRVQ